MAPARRRRHADLPPLNETSSGASREREFRVADTDVVSMVRYVRDRACNGLTVVGLLAGEEARRRGSPRTTTLEFRWNSTPSCGLPNREPGHERAAVSGV